MRVYAVYLQWCGFLHSSFVFLVVKGEISRIEFLSCFSDKVDLLKNFKDWVSFCLLSRYCYFFFNIYVSSRPLQR